MGKFKIEMGDITTYAVDGIECCQHNASWRRRGRRCDSPGSRTGIAGGMQDVRRM